MAENKIQVELTADDQMTKVLKGAKAAADNLGQGFQNIQKDAGDFGKAFGVIAGVGVVALKTFVDAAMESERVTAQLNNVIKSTGGAAGVSAEMATGLASSLQKVTTVGDEAIISGENMLLTFTNIGSKVFPQATETMLDMAVAMNNGVTPSAEQLSAQAIQLGKALNDPTKGMAALTKVGVSFNDQQRKQIETMQKHGDIMGAQKVILAELSKEFGGSAKAAAQTFGGAIENMNNRLGELYETFGRAIIPIITEFTAKLQDVLTWFENLSPQQQDFIAKTILIGTALAGAVAAVGLLVAALNPITIAVAAVVAGFAYLSVELAKYGMTWEEFGVSVGVVWAQFRYDVEYNVDLIIWKIRQLTLATDKELKDLATSMDEHLAITYKDVSDGQDKLNELYRTKMGEQKKTVEDAIAAQRDVVDKSTGEAKDAAKKQLEQMKTDGLKQFSDLKLGSTAELAAMRKAEETEMTKANAMMNEKFSAQVQSTLTWGQHLIENLSNGVWAKMPVLGAAIEKAKAIMNQIHQSYNPELPAQLWGEHFLENFTAGMKASEPQVFAQTEQMKAALKAQYGSDGEIAKIMKEWTKDKTVGQHFQEIADQVAAESQRLSDEFTKEKADYDDLNVKVGDALQDLKQKHEEALSAINDKIESTKKSIKDLNDNYKIDIQSTDTSIGEEVVKQQDLVADLKQQIADAQTDVQNLQSQPNDGSQATAKENADAQKKLTDLQAQYDKEYAALSTFLSNSKGLEDEIAEARRREGLTDFQRFIEDTDARKKALTDEYNTKLDLLNQEKESLQDQRTKEDAIYQAKMVQFAAVQVSFIAMQNTFTTGLSTMATVAAQKTAAIQQSLNAMKAALDKMGLLNGNAQSPGITTTTVPKFANGGIAQATPGGMLAHIAEAGMNEAVVPLPNGKSIPVEMSGNMGGRNVTVTMNFGDINISKDVDKDQFFSEMEDRLTRSIQLQVLGSI